MVMYFSEVCYVWTKVSVVCWNLEGLHALECVINGILNNLGSGLNDVIIIISAGTSVTLKYYCWIIFW